MTKLLWFISIILALTARAGAQQPEAETTEPPANEKDPPVEAQVSTGDVYQRVALVRAEIDLIRLEMGKPEVDPPPIHIDGAASREVYFQARTLGYKADRLAFEHTRGRVKAPPPPQGEIKPADVLAMVDMALDRVITVKQSLGIEEAAELSAQETTVEPSHVFLSILNANREINCLLDQRFAPGDAFQEVTLAIAYLSRLLDEPGQVSTPPDPQPRERRKRPADVYRGLIACFEMVHQIGEVSSVPMLDLTVNEEQIDTVEPSDVYDVASLLVAEVTHLHRQLGKARPPRRVVDPGRKLPSDVYQRIGILSDQLKALQLKAQANPGWLNE